MKRPFAAFAVISLLVLGVFALVGMPSTGCTPAEEAQFAETHPSLAPATRAAESIEKKIDGAVPVIKTIADDTKGVGNAAATIGVPYASAIAGVAGLLSSLAGLWAGRRSGQESLVGSFVDTYKAWHDEGAPGVTPAMTNEFQKLASAAPKVSAAVGAAIAALKTS